MNSYIRWSPKAKTSSTTRTRRAQTFEDRVDCIIIVPMDFGDHKRELEEVAIDAAFGRDACADIARDVMVGNVEIPRDGMRIGWPPLNSSWTRYGAGKMSVSLTYRGRVTPTRYLCE